MFPWTRPRMRASFTSMSARMMPCSPISSRSQFRMSPSNSPSMRSVPGTIRVPRSEVPRPTTVLGCAGSAPSLDRERNFIMAAFLSGARALHHPPGLEEALEVGLAEVHELHLSTPAPGRDRDAGPELPLQLRFPLHHPLRTRGPGAGVLAAEAAAYESLGAAHREALGLDVAGGRKLISRSRKREKRAGMSGGQCSTSNHLAHFWWK